MGDPRNHTVLRLASQWIGRADSAPNDAALLERIARHGDEAAFAELVSRHGPGIWALCRRLARTEADAEDAFQATFLVLSQKASRVRSAASVGSWLYGVASRVTRKARSRLDRTPDPARLRTAATLDPATSLSWGEVRAALDEELARLPDSLRAPILLCYFDGLTQDEAAAELGWKARVVKDRVARGRALLRARFTRRGIELPLALAVPLLSSSVASAVPERLVASTAGIVCGKSAALSRVVVALARTESPTMFSVRLAFLVASAAGILAVGTLLGRVPADPIDAAPAVESQPQNAEAPQSTGEVRIGTAQFRENSGWHKRVFFLDDGKTLLTTSDGPTVRYWDVESGKKLHEITLSGMYMDAAFARAGNLLAIVGLHFPEGDREKADTALWLIDTAARKVVHTIPMPGNNRGNSQQVQISADGTRVFVEWEGDVRVVDAKSGEVLKRHKGQINAGAMAASADGRRVATGRYEVFLWDWQVVDAPMKIASIGGFGTERMIFGSDNKTLYVAGAGGIVSAYDGTGRLLRTLDLEQTPWNWSFSPDGKSLAVVYYQSNRADTRRHAVHVWDLETGKRVSRLPFGHQAASHVSWSPDGSRLAAVTDTRIWAWDVKTGQSLGSVAAGHEALVTEFAFAPDGGLFTSSDDHTIRSWDTAGKAGLLLEQDAWVRGIALSPDGSLVAGSALRDDLRVWDAMSGKEKFRLLGNGSMGGTRKVRFTPDGKRLVAWGDDLYLRLWDMRNGKLLAEHRTLPDGMTEADLNDESKSIRLLGFWSADLSLDGSSFAFTQHRAVQIFDVETGKERLKFEPEPNGVATLAFSPDGKRLAVAGRGKSTEIRLPNGLSRFTTAPEHLTGVWDLATQKVVWQVVAPGSRAREVRFTNDGSRLAELLDLDEKYSILIRDGATGKDIGRVLLPSSISHFGFDRTGKRLAVSFLDTTAIVYDLESALMPVK